MSGTVLPTILTVAGLQPQAPATLREQLIASATAASPGLSMRLPGSLIDDLGSTSIAGLVQVDQARVETVNSLTPYGANAFILNQLGQIYGVPLGGASNTSVPVVFTGSPGYVINQGFTVSDGTNQYTLTTGTVIQSNGMSSTITALATAPGSWAVPQNTVTTIATSVPSSVTISVTNPIAGLPGLPTQDESDYRTQVLAAGVATCLGTPLWLRTQLLLVPGVQSRLVSIRPATGGGGWEVICGGGDPYAVAAAIYRSVPDISTLIGSTLAVEGITNANPGVVTTALKHGLVTGQAIQITGVVGMSGINGTSLTATVITPYTFSIGINTTSSGTYTSGGAVTPNARNTVVSLSDPPDHYNIPIVLPLQQQVAMTVLWNTSAANFVSASAIAQAATPALVTYINSITVGQPINVFELNAVFLAAVAPLISTVLVTRLVFEVSIDGVGVAATSGTGIIQGDAESYLLTSSTSINVTQG